jgi:hypothetical protein
MKVGTCTAIALGLALAAVAATAEPPNLDLEPRIRPGDLVLVWARLRDCPDGMRLVEVERASERSASLLDLGDVPLLGHKPSAVRAELARLYRARVPGRPVPPMRIDVDRFANARDEVLWLEFSADELATCWREKLHRPDRLPSPRLKHLASR